GRPHALPAVRPRRDRRRRAGAVGGRLPGYRALRGPRGAGLLDHVRVRGSLRPMRGRLVDDPPRPVRELPGGCMSHDHDHHHPREKSEVELRAEALEALLAEKGLVSTDAIDAVVDLYENDVGPQNGARVIARAWVDPEFKARLPGEGTARLGDT